ncbi:hypothetical protein MTsPCn9_09500 [Croceitalea sp. MTPC9]|uniref:TylF/MycF/NovP-related O-methyltransferase n=1 Tax=unclassified Croceitalea TaxID=2632280 RepID=UPI002B3D51D1|nr:hypothetical protein MTsPCn6_27740 [Croceitalea sp. MTPC6]GMN16014.1 hypothetical protein MTsPCn9_09500 [Croceitalea sp. MTPC9]
MLLKTLKKKRRTIALKQARWLGVNFSNFLLHLSYLIKNSNHFRKYAHIKTLSNRSDFYETIKNKENLRKEDIFFIEFGVWKGQSFKWWLAHNTNKNSRFTGFDSFEGLPEDWKKNHFKGKFSTLGKTPEGVNDERSSFEKGLFQETLFAFTRENDLALKNKKLVIHLDADLYSSTIYVLSTLLPFIKQSDILIFDEFYILQSPHHEFRAFLDFVTMTGCEYEGIAKTNTQFALKIM